MPLRNRVTPLGELVAASGRGLVYGNRGCLHDEHGAVRRRYAGRRWIACRLEFRGRRRNALLQPGRYTELFFLDEATAFAAGHRPCAECRREDYDRFTAIWRDLHHGPARADAIDERLHTERVAGDGAHRLHDAVLADLPDGTFVLEGGEPWLVHGHALRRWTPDGYRDSRSRHDGRTTLVTPPSLVAVLRSGWHGDVPFLHPSVRAA